MEHVIASVAEEILHTLLTFDNRTNCSTKLTFQAHFGGTSLHDVLYNFQRCRVAVLFAGEVNHFVIRVGVDLLRQSWRLWSNST